MSADRGATRTRADAVRNCERVVAAAAEVLAEKGAEAGVPEIAARAGVGKAHRLPLLPDQGAPDRRGRWSSGCEDFEPSASRAQLDAPDAWAGVRASCSCDSAERQARDCAFAAGAGARRRPGAARGRAAPRCGHARRRADGPREGRGPDRARASTAATCACCGRAWPAMLAPTATRDPAEWRRYAGLVLRALAA